jgi:tRNA threonylcarbamoyladenosine biosynthesis protein TsaB
MILLIDTSQEKGVVALAKEGNILHSEENIIAKDHASWLHMAISRILGEAKITVRDLQAVSVVSGPGSYTGLRVGMAAAKGFCYALKIPLITQNSLQLMALSMIPQALKKNALICPMIDARREEVFTALYQVLPDAGGMTPNAQLSTANCQLSTGLKEILPPQAKILDKTAFEKELLLDSIIFSGTGAEKWKNISTSPLCIFEPQNAVIQSFAQISQWDFEFGNWADPIYAEPVYLKEFFSY